MRCDVRSSIRYSCRCRYDKIIMYDTSAANDLTIYLLGLTVANVHLEARAAEIVKLLPDLPFLVPPLFHLHVDLRYREEERLKHCHCLMPHDRALEEAEEVVLREASHYHWNAPEALEVAEVLNHSQCSGEASLKGELAGRPYSKQVKLPGST